jgi:hypothetical protein
MADISPLGPQGAQPIDALKSSPPTSPKGAVESAQGKLRIALVDSGCGGAMTAALLHGEIRQLGSYFCLPIGDKPAKQAVAYTAAMVLWPLIAPLNDKKGEQGQDVADHVIIACNTASVRKEGAIELIKEFLKGYEENKAEYNLSESIQENISNLLGKLKADPNYLNDHIHEIVTPTANAGAEAAFEALKKNDEFFIRVDSTNGTAKAGVYPEKICKHLDNLMGTEGYEKKEKTYR